MRAAAARVRSRNRAVALGVAAFVVAVFATVLLVGVLDHLSGSAGAAAHDGAAHASVPADRVPHVR